MSPRFHANIDGIDGSGVCFRCSDAGERCTSELKMFLSAFLSFSPLVFSLDVMSSYHVSIYLLLLGLVSHRTSINI